MKKLTLLIALIASLILLFGDVSGSKTSHLSLKVLDVGQGDSLYLRLPDKRDVVIDAGPNEGVLAPLGQAMPLGDRKIELLIISHNHADHIGGLKSILEHYQVDQIWLSGAINTTDQYLGALETIRAKHIPTTVVKAGNSLTMGEVELIVLHPPTDMTGQEPADQHDATIALKLNYKQFCAWLTGDLSAHHELDLLEAAKQLRQSTECPVLKVTHHGSAYGTSTEFLAAVKPKVGIISVGAPNRYGHPAPSLLKRLQNLGITIYRTDQQGTISVTSDGQQFWTKTER